MPMTAHARHRKSQEDVDAAQRALDHEVSVGLDSDAGMSRHPDRRVLHRDGVRRFLWRLLDGSALLVANLPLSTTEALAWCVVATQLLAAHVAGTASRRRHEAHDDRIHVSQHERWLGTAAFVVGILIGLVVAAIRAFGSGNWLVGVLFAAIEVGLFVAMAWMATRWHSVLVTVRTWAKARRWVADQTADYATMRFSRADARAADSKEQLARVAQQVVGRVTVIERASINQYAAHHPNDTIPVFPMPEWVPAVGELAEYRFPTELSVTETSTALRRLSAGESSLGQAA